MKWVILGILVLIAAVRVSAPVWARSILLAKLRSACPECEFQVSRLEFSVFSRRVRAHDVTIAGDPKSSSRYRIQVRLLEATYGLDQWIEIFAEGLDFALTERKSEGPPPDYDATLRRIPALKVRALRLIDSRFTYMHEDRGVPSLISFHSIDLTTGSFVTKRSLATENSVDVRLQARTSSGGRIEINTRVGLFENEKIDQVDIALRAVDFGDLNSFLLPSSGLRMAGRLLKADAKLDVRKTKLSGRVEMRYQGLEMKYLKGEAGQSALSAGFKNLLVSLAIHKETPASGERGSDVKLEGEQKKDETVFQFLLRNLEDGAERIMKR